MGDDTVMNPPDGAGKGLTRRAPRALSVALKHLMFGVICHVSNQIGIAHKFPPHHISPLWPTNVILFAVLVVAPIPHWWAYALAFLAPLVIYDALVRALRSGVLYAVGNLIELFIAAVVVRRFVGGPRAFASLGSLVVYILVAAVLAPFTSAFVAAPAATQAPTGAAQAKPSLRQDATFTHITIEQGLSDQRVEAIVQDRAGFIWFGTDNGLNRYDGYSVVAYLNDPTNPHSLSSNSVLVLHEDRSGTLWVGTRSGLNAFDRRTERFIHYRHDPEDPRSLSHNMVIAIHEDRSGVLWLGTQAGLNRFDRATGTFTAFRHDPANPQSLSHDTVRAISEDRSGVLWLGTLAGLNRFDRATGTFTAFRHDPANPQSLSHDVVWDIHVDRAGTMWVGTDGGGLNRFDPATGTFAHYRHDPKNAHSLGADWVDCLFEDASGALWVGTFGGGLSVLDAARQTFTTYRHDATIPTSLSHDQVAHIIADRAGLLWIGTLSGGVDVYNPQQQAFTIYRHDPKVANSLASDLVSAVHEDPDGVLWIGTQDRGLDRFDRRSGQIVHYPPDPENPKRLGHPWVAALQQDRTGALWVGTYGGGLYRFERATKTFIAYHHDPANPQSLSHDAIVDLHLDRSAALWVATRGGGLNRFDQARGAFTAYRCDRANPESLSSDWVSVIAEDQRGSLWIGTRGDGLNRLEPATGHITRYRHDPQNPASLSDDTIWTIHLDRAGVLWVGTYSGGLDRFDPASGTFTHYRERDGLPSNRIVSILEDGTTADPAAGNLWIGTGRGLAKLDRDRKTFQVYDKSTGLPLTEYNRGCYRTRNGELLLSTTHGLIAFDPAAVRDDAYVAPVVFTNFLLANKPVAIGETSPLRQAIDQTDTIELTYADRVISIEFAALNYRAPRQSRYRYKLEGFDDDWTDVGSTRRLVTYTNLEPSRYVFRVQGANANGVWNEPAQSLTIVVAPPWWATWWFRGPALALLVGGAFGIYAWRVNGLRRQQRALEAEIGERRKAEERLRENQGELQILSGQLIQAQESERRRIAREMHDDWTQRLAVLGINIATVEQQLGAPDQARPLLLTMKGQLVRLAEDVHALSRQLHPSILDELGLVDALRSECASFSEREGIAISYCPEDVPASLPKEVALCVYRIAQEALRNIAKHATVDQAWVSLAVNNQGLQLRVQDRGAGFDATGVHRRPGLGLSSMQERARLVQADLSITSESGLGTTVLVRVPLTGGDS